MRSGGSTASASSRRSGTTASSPGEVSDHFRRDVRRWRPVLEEHLGALGGVKIEDKLFSVAVHYRQSREKRRARAAILDAAASLGAVRVVRGKQVVNILPEGAPHKGMALESARARRGCDTALYVGDDETDEDVFALDQPGQLLSIRVGRKNGSQAVYYIRSQREIDTLLRHLLEMRQADSARTRRTR